MYAAGLEYLLLCALLYTPGLLVYAKAKREKGQEIFPSGVEKGLSLTLIAGGGMAINQIMNGAISLS